MDNFHQAIAEWLRGWAAREHVTQGEIADVLGIRRQVVSNRMRGDTPFTVDELFWMASHWGLDLDRIIAEARGIWAQKGAGSDVVTQSDVTIAAKRGLSRAEQRRRIVGDEDEGA